MCYIGKVKLGLSPIGYAMRIYTYNTRCLADHHEAKNRGLGNFFYFLYICLYKYSRI